MFLLYVDSPSTLYCIIGLSTLVSLQRYGRNWDCSIFGSRTHLFLGIIEEIQEGPNNISWTSQNAPSKPRREREI